MSLEFTITFNVPAKVLYNALLDPMYYIQHDPQGDHAIHQSPLQSRAKRRRPICYFGWKNPRRVQTTNSERKARPIVEVQRLAIILHGHHHHH